MFNAIPENDGLFSRRHWLKAAGALTIGATLARSSRTTGADDAAAGPGPSSDGGAKAKEIPLMRIGILIGTVSRPTVEATFDAVKACGLDCIQMSMDCAGLSAMPERIAPELTARIRTAAADRGIEIASLQGTFNMSHPDAEHRRWGLGRLKALAEACAGLGTSKIHLCTGTRDRDNMWRRHPDNDSPEAWRDMVGCVREATAIAKEHTVVIRITRNLFKKMLEGYPEAAVRLRDIMAARVDEWTRDLVAVQRVMDKKS